MARPANIPGDPVLLQAALEGLELQRQRIDEQISQVRALLGKERPRSAAANHADATQGVKRRKLSTAARKRIAAAQKRRWAEFRKTHAAVKEK
jgi:hypothetical protein